MKRIVSGILATLIIISGTACSFLEKKEEPTFEPGDVVPEDVFVWQDNVIIDLNKDSELLPELTQLIIPERCQGLGDSFLTNQENQIESVKFAGKQNMVIDLAFANTDQLQSVDLPENLEEVGYMAFYKATGLTSVNLPDQVKIIGERAFADNPNLTDLSWPENLKAIESQAFRNCTGLEKIVLPDNLENIGAYAFADCSNLKEVHMPASIRHMGIMLFKDSGIKDIYFPETFQFDKNDRDAFFDLQGVKMHVVEGSVLDLNFKNLFPSTVEKVVEKK